MQIKLWKNFSKRSKSTKQPADASATIINATLKAPTSIESPTFTVLGNDMEYNYAFAFGHYYFIDNIIQNTNGTSDLICSQDLLATYKTYVGNYTGYVVRSASSSDGELLDPMYPIKTKLSQNHINSVASPFSNDYGFSGGSFIVGIINNDSNVAGAVSYYAMTNGAFRTLMNGLFDSDNMQSVLRLEALTDTAWAEMVADYNPFQYISSVFFVPYSPSQLPHLTPVSTLNLGYFQLRLGSGETPKYVYPLDASSSMLKTHTLDIAIPKHPQAASRGAFLNSGQYSSYVLSFYPFGDIEVPADLIKDDNTLHLQVMTDLITGESRLTAYGQYTNVVASSTVQLGLNVQIAQLTTKVLQNAAAVGANVASVFTFNPANWVLGPLKAYSSYIGAKVPTLSTSGSNGGFLAYKQNFEDTIDLQATFYLIADEDNVHNGRPLCKYVQISTLSGYVQTDFASIDIPSLGNDRDELNNIMDSGFYYE